VHAAVRPGFIDYNAVRESWSAALEDGGWHSRTGTHRFHAGDDYGQHSNGFSSARVCAHYLAGYLRKSLLSESRVKGERRFESSGCYVPVAVVSQGLTLGEAPAVIRDTFGCDAVPFFRDGVVMGYWFDSGG